MLTFCSKCVMDGSVAEITYEQGVCNFCLQAQQALKEAEGEKSNLVYKLLKIKGDGIGKTYDCLIGLSGGVDSSTVLVNAVKLGLRPLCFSVDNGYNDAKADENIMRLVEQLKVPFVRYAIDLNKFKELQAAFMKGGVKNLEALTDHILFATTYEMAGRYKIKWILTGGNVATESIMPASWGEDPRDLYWIKSVYKKMTGKRLTGLPVISLWKEQYYRHLKGIKFLRLLDYLDYDLAKAKQALKVYGWQDYYQKHCESLFTWWYQSYYLFEKWGIDKRKAFYSSLINSNQMTRKEAMDLLADRPEYPSLGIEIKVMQYPKKEYHDYPNSEWVRKLVIKLYGTLRRLHAIRD